MSCLWQGNVQSIEWPHHDPPIVDLPLEMWWANDHREKAATKLAGAKLVFEKYVFLTDVPVWTVCGPEITIMTKDVSCRDYFTEFACLDRILLQVSIISDSPSSFTHLLLFPVKEELSVRFAARPVNVKTSPQKRVATVPQPVPQPVPQHKVVVASANSSSPVLTARNADPVPAGSQIEAPKSVSNVKKALQQTLMGALRLRKIRSSDTNFKKIFYSVQSLVELSLQNTDKEHISLELIHEKVEAILSVID